MKSLIALARKWAVELVVLFVLLVVANIALDIYRTKQSDVQKLSAVQLQAVSANLSSEQLARWHSGEALVLYVWAHWCGFCKITSPIVSNFATEGLVTSIAFKSGGDAEVFRYMKSKALTFPVINDPSGSLSAALDVSATPTLLVIDSDGQLLVKHVGLFTGFGLKGRVHWLSNDVVRETP